MQLGENSMGIYLDNGATSYPKPNQVAKAVFDFMVDVGVSSESLSLNYSIKMTLRRSFLL